MYAPVKQKVSNPEFIAEDFLAEYLTITHSAFILSPCLRFQLSTALRNQARSLERENEPI